MKRLVLVMALFVVSVGAARADDYTYHGTRTGIMQARICLDHAYVMSGHVAAWLGIADPMTGNWVQAGIEQTKDYPATFAYIEVGHGGNQTMLHVLVRARCTFVRLLHVGPGVWQVQLGSTRSPRVYVPQAKPMLTAESYGRGSNLYRYSFTSAQS